MIQTKLPKKIFGEDERVAPAARSHFISIFAGNKELFFVFSGGQRYVLFTIRSKLFLLLYHSFYKPGSYPEMMQYLFQKAEGKDRITI
jgi:hypothetical protein